MRLTDILKPANIRVPLIAAGKGDAIGELVNLLHANGEIPDARKVLDAVLDREATRTTGIGNGVAIPHGKAPGVDHLVMAIGKPAAPVDFQSIDGRPVTMIWLLCSPPEQTSAHIQALARVSRLTIIDKFRQSLNAATTPEEVYDLIVKQEAAF